jgi:hypothetical protein
MFLFPALVKCLFFVFVNADYFTNPTSFTTGTNGANDQTQDLTYSVTLGQNVQVSWYSPALDGIYISLSIGYWNQGSTGTIIKGLLSKS